MRRSGISQDKRHHYVDRQRQPRIDERNATATVYATSEPISFTRRLKAVAMTNPNRASQPG